MAENGTASQKLDEASGTTTGFEDGMADAVNMNNDRFPQPYSRRKSDLIAPTARIPPLISGLYSHPTERIKGDGESDCDSKSGLNSRKWMSPSESGTEADDESFNFIRALPAPPIKLRKGLRGSKEEEGDLTPTQLDREVIRLSDLGIPEPRASEPVPELEDPQQETRSKRVRRRRGEILRRVLEGALLALSGALVLANQHVWWMLSRAEKFSILTHAVVVASVYAAYPLRLVTYSWRRTVPRKGIWESFRLSAGFDPAPYIYSAILPAIVALSIFSGFKQALVPNLVLGIASIPRHVVSRFDPKRTSGMTHWLLTIIPVIVYERINQHQQIAPEVSWTASREILAAMYPLHINLVVVLHSFTTTSLLPAELQLFSISLINLLILATSPQMKITSAILWIGGLGVVILCSSVLRWGVALARVPRWRLRRAGRIVQARQSFIKALNEGLQKKDDRKKRGDVVESDADDDEVNPRVKPERLGLDDLKKEVLNALHNFFPVQNDESLSAFEDFSGRKPSLQGSPRSAHGRKRRNTLPAKTVTTLDDSIHSKGVRNRSRTDEASFFVSLTPTQALLRKWLYAGYVYFIIVFLILGPIRIVISKYALDGAEPFGWAIGYLFGNLQKVRFWVVTNSLIESWISLPPLQDDWSWSSERLGRATEYRNSIGAANTRILLVFYSAFTVVSGLISVLSLPASVEVDTRRKVFHGTMVAMLLPTIYFDPPFFSLALAIVLACFCLLDLLRASQLPPLSKPLANFLAPFVDGRDNRGPVVISHIFLLVGCAVPLWLSLAAAQLAGDAPWRGWDAGFVSETAIVAIAGGVKESSGLVVEVRHVSLLAGVICVGMGDAAASLVGRRFGRHKLPWAGGKSLEGSAAFAAAVVVGLVFGKAWLWLGQWTDEVQVVKWSWVPLIWKSWIAAMGASLMEAVLTGGNDNVVVPVVLWVLVRAMRI